MNEYPFRAGDRQNFYGGAKAGRLFSVCDQTAPPAGYTGQTGFVATTPTFMFRKSAGSTYHIFRNVELAQKGTVAAAMITIDVMLSSVDRLSGGGTAIVPKNVSTDKQAASKAILDLTVLANPTATAATATSWFHKSYSAVPLLGNTISLDFLDGIVLGPTASLLLYCYAAGTAPTLALNADILEEAAVAPGLGT